MRIGMVCPYSLAVPGGVQSHVLGLAGTLRGLGHDVAVLAPGDGHGTLPGGVTSAGRAVSVPYNGSVAPVSFGPVGYARARRWLRRHDFDVLHIHEPMCPSLALLALLAAHGPVVATFHAAIGRSPTLLAFRGLLRGRLDKLAARIAVSAPARRVLVEHMGGDAVEIPNGVDVHAFARATPLAGYPRPGGTVGFVGRFDEPRKGMAVLLDALHQAARDRPGLQLLVVGRGDAGALRRAAGPELAGRLVVLGDTDEPTKARALRSVDLLCAPNLAGESFGMILTEAMAAGTPVVASDLDGFRPVLADGRAGVLVPPGDAATLAGALTRLLDDPARRAGLTNAGLARVEALNWPVIARQVLGIYEAAVAASPAC